MICGEKVKKFFDSMEKLFGRIIERDFARKVATNTHTIQEIDGMKLTLPVNNVYTIGCGAIIYGVGIYESTGKKIICVDRMNDVCSNSVRLLEKTVSASISEIEIFDFIVEILLDDIASGILTANKVSITHIDGEDLLIVDVWINYAEKKIACSSPYWYDNYLYSTFFEAGTNILTCFEKQKELLRESKSEKQMLAQPCDSEKKHNFSLLDILPGELSESLFRNKLKSGIQSRKDKYDFCERPELFRPCTVDEIAEMLGYLEPPSIGGGGGGSRKRKFLESGNKKH